MGEACVLCSERLWLALVPSSRRVTPTESPLVLGTVSIGVCRGFSPFCWLAWQIVDILPLIASVLPAIVLLYSTLYVH